MNKFTWIVLAVLVLGGVGFYFFGSGNGNLPSIDNSSGKNIQPPVLPE